MDRRNENWALKSLRKALCLAKTQNSPWREEPFAHSKTWWRKYYGVGVFCCLRNWKTFTHWRNYEFKWLPESVYPSVRYLRHGRDWILQQDNDPKHTSKSTQDWLRKKKLKVLEWPSQSPDLNPNEMLWFDVKHGAMQESPPTWKNYGRFVMKSGQKFLGLVTTIDNWLQKVSCCSYCSQWRNY